VLDFRPPEDNALVIGLMRLFMPQVLKYRCHDARVAVEGDGIARFKQLAGSHTLICPNHSFRHDPEVMFYFSNLVGEVFNFIAAREVFDYHNGFNGWLLQKLGVYSVVRGAADRESFKTTRSILVAGKKKLVLFPEGEISWQNEALLPLESGCVQLSFWALDELQKTEPQTPVYVLPVALKYSYRGNIIPQLEWCLEKLEKRLGMEEHATESLYQRVRGAAIVVLTALERQYDVKPAPDAALNDRIIAVRTEALKKLAEVLSVELPPLKTSHLDWIRVLRNTMDDFIYGDTKDLSSYQRQMHEEKASKIRGYYRDLDRIVSFIAIYDGYLQPPATQERLANVIEMLEFEVFGEKTIKGPRNVTVDVGQPINLLERYTDYKANKRKATESITHEVSQQLRDMLDVMEKQREPVYVT
jgi:1-acyl-sn-glycerol-3-phosphate acyltransferase